MERETHQFRVTSVWTGNSDGDGVLTGEDVRRTEYGVPEGLGGSAGRSNPEEMLVSAVAACYSITLALLAERRRLPLTRIEVSAVGEVVRQPDRTLKFTRIHLTPVLTVGDVDQRQKATLLECAHQAEDRCVISKALRGNVEVTADPVIAEE